MLKNAMRTPPGSPEVSKSMSTFPEPQKGSQVQLPSPITDYCEKFSSHLEPLWQVGGHEVDPHAIRSQFYNSYDLFPYDSDIAQYLDSMVFGTNDMQLRGVLGKGSYSTVCEFTIDGKDVAVKLPTNVKMAKVVYKEALIYQHLSKFGTGYLPVCHGLTFFNTRNFKQIRVGQELPGLVISKARGTLEDHINQIVDGNDGIFIGKDMWWKLFKELIEVLFIFRNHAHVIHGDFKPSNILMGDRFIVSDFTSSQILTTDNVTVRQHIDTTLHYSAPELLEGGSPSYISDLYAVGVTLLVALTGKEPYAQLPKNNMILLMEAIKKNKIFQVLDANSLSRLENHPSEFGILKSILLDRCSLDSLAELV